MALSKKIEKSESAIASKKAAAERKREKNRELAKFLKGPGEPSINPLEYKISLIRALNWYNTNTENKEVRKYLNDYLISTNRKKLIPRINKAGDLEVRSIGLLCRLKSRGEYIDSDHEALIESKISEILDSNPDDIVISEPLRIKEKVKVDSSYEESLIICEDIEGAIDEFILDKTTKFDPSSYLKSKECSSQIAKHISDYYTRMLTELIDCDGEGYRLTKSQFKKFVQFIQSIVDACNQQKVSSKIRKPRKKKAISPSKMVSKIKYQKEYIDLNLKSIKPESIVDSTELWVYNTRYRKLIVYRAEKNGKLTVKGTTILGFDIKESKQVMLRKPEEFFKTTQLAKRALSNGFKTITTKPVTPNGRINEDTILLGAFT